ncbi:extracellular calcium-sensing receptor-like [Rhinoderma darwinii]|uniref:extracellular calcium-sensing receptor-like n=1 Tax=Rhinoderma darwinii TaxID=43563 RepID=UPI003F6663DB
MSAYVKENLERGFIQKSSSPDGARLFFMKKKDGPLRPCIDYRVICSMGQMCRLPPTSDLEGIRQLGDIMIGIVLPIITDKIYQKFTFNVRPARTSCRLFNLESYHRLQSFLFAVEEINRDPNILSNITLGFQMYETCNIPHYELQGALQFLTDSNMAMTNNQCNSRPLFNVVIGATLSSKSIILAHILGTFRYPQISTFSSISLLSNRNVFSSFFRTVSSDKVQSIGLARLILSFGWTWIGLVALDNDYGFQGIQPIREEIVKAGACVAFMEYIRLGQPDFNAPHIVKVIKESTAKVVVVFANDVEFIVICNEMVKQNVTGRIFIGNAGWSRSDLMYISNYFQTLSGSLGLASNDYVAQGLSKFLAKIHPSTSTTSWTRMYWEKAFNCQFLIKNQTVSLENSAKVCTGSERLEDIKDNPNYISSLKSAYTMFNSVHVLSKALDDLKSCKIGEGPFSNGACANIWNFKPWQLTYYIRRVRLNINVDNEKYFENGDHPSVYAIVNWQLNADKIMTQVKIGEYNIAVPRHQALTMNSSLILWNLGSKQVGENTDNNNEEYDLGHHRSLLKFNNLRKGSTQDLPVPPQDLSYLGTKCGESGNKCVNSALLIYDTKVPDSDCTDRCTMGFRKAALQGKPSSCYACVPCRQGEISNQTDSLNCLRCPWDQWPNPERSRCLPKPMEFLSYEDALGATLTATSIMSSIVPPLILRLFFYHNSTPLVKASNCSLSCLLLMSLSLCFFCSLGFIGYPDHDKCLLRQVSFGLVFTLCVACILAKTIMVVFAFMATRPGSSLRKWTTLRVSYTIIYFCFLLQLILCITWMSVRPPFPQLNTEDKPELIIVNCNEGSPIAFWAMLSYLFILATISFIVAFLARKLLDSFNEAQFITFSMLAFLCVWLSFIPASVSAQGKYTVAMEVFAILASSWALLICMFLPKCFILLFRPEMNSKEYLIMRNLR